MAIRRSVSWLLMALVVALVPMADASSTDQTWIGGVYDNADCDDVIGFATSAVDAIDVQILCDTKPIQMVVASAVHIDGDSSRICTFSSSSPRAPPRPSSLPLA